MLSTTVKLSQGTRDELHEIKESMGFESIEELQRFFIGASNSQKIKKEVPVLTSAIECLDEMATQLRGHLSSAGESFIISGKKYADTLKIQKEQFDSTLNTLQTEIAALKKNLADNDPETLKAESNKLNAELKKNQDEVFRLEKENTKLREDHAAALIAASDEAAAKLALAHNENAELSKALATAATDYAAELKKMMEKFKQPTPAPIASPLSNPKAKSTVA